MRDAYVLPVSVFNLVHGPKLYHYRVADNSIRIYSLWRVCQVQPIIKSRAVSHKTDVRKKDLIAVIDGSDVLYGMVTWVNRSDDEAGVFLFKDREYDTIDLSLFESESGMGSKIRWRIMR